jgi:transposase
LHPNQITQWKTQLLERFAGAFDSGVSQEPAEDVKALHAKIGELTLEVDF